MCRRRGRRAMDPDVSLRAVLHAACELAARMAGNAPLSLIAAKRVVDELMKDAERRDRALCDKVVADCFASKDYIEGRRAFMEKRKPAFTGT